MHSIFSYSTPSPLTLASPQHQCIPYTLTQPNHHCCFQTLSPDPTTIIFHKVSFCPTTIVFHMLSSIHPQPTPSSPDTITNFHQYNVDNHSIQENQICEKTNTVATDLANVTIASHKDDATDKIPTEKGAKKVDAQTKFPRKKSIPETILKGCQGSRQSWWY